MLRKKKINIVDFKSHNVLDSSEFYDLFKNIFL